MSEKSLRTSKGVETGSGRLATGIEGLDNILEGGFPANRIYLIEGDPGTGKTTLALQFLLEGASAGRAVLYVTLSETKEELTRSPIRTAGRSTASTSTSLSRPKTASSPKRSTPSFTLRKSSSARRPARCSKKWSASSPRRVVFDSLSEMRLLARDPLRYRRQILALKQYFAGQQCTVLLAGRQRTSTGETCRCNQSRTAWSRWNIWRSNTERSGGVCGSSNCAAARYRGGYHDFNIETGGVGVFPRLVAAEHRQDFAQEAVTSDVPELDALLGGGLDRGSSTLDSRPGGLRQVVASARSSPRPPRRGASMPPSFVFDEILETYIARAAGHRHEIYGASESRAHHLAAG